MEAEKPNAVIGSASAEANEAAELFNKQVDQQKLAAMAARVAQLQDEDAELRARHDKREQETHEFVAYFQKEIQTRDKQLTKLGEEPAAARLSHASHLSRCSRREIPSASTSRSKRLPRRKLRPSRYFTCARSCISSNCSAR